MLIFVFRAPRLGLLLLLGCTTKLTFSLGEESSPTFKLPPDDKPAPSKVSLKGREIGQPEPESVKPKLPGKVDLRGLKAKAAKEGLKEGEKRKPTPEELEKLRGLVLQNLLERLDVNNDGKMSLDEMIKFAQDKHYQNAHADAKSILPTMDADQDGKLSLKEVTDTWDLLLGSYFQPVGNGTNETENATETALAEAELERTKVFEKKKFEAADKDKDGFLNETEVTSMIYPHTDPDTMEVQIQDFIEQHDHNGNGMIDMHEYNKTGENHHPELKHDFHGLDQDEDGQLSLHELKPWTDGTFSWKKLLTKVLHMLDQDGDDHVTVDELKKEVDSLPPELHEWALHSEEF